MFDFGKYDFVTYIYKFKDNYKIGNIITIGDTSYKILEVDEVNKLVLIVPED